MVDSRNESRRRSTTFPIATGCSKKKLAPRSSLQFKVGPQFTSTVIKSRIVNSLGLEITPLLNPRIDRGFERIDGEWVGYKRNYFTLVGTYQFLGVQFDEFARDQYYVIDPSSDSKIKIKYFGLRLVSRSAEDGSNVSLVQHTAKRDRGPQFSPQIQPAVPSELPNHDIIRESANIRNTSKIAKLNSIFVYERDLLDKGNHRSNPENLQRYPHDRIAKVARYDRIQFSSSVNHKKPSSNNKRFKLFMELVGFTSKNDFVTLAYSETPPLIIRGRSPSNYTESNEKGCNRCSTELKAPSPPPVNELVFEKIPIQLDDIATYDILRAATDALSDLSPNSSSRQDRKKIKRGRKPRENKLARKVSKKKSKPLKKKTASGKEKKIDVLNDISLNLPVPIAGDLNKDFIKLENFLNIDFEDNLLLQNIENNEFSESFIDIQQLEELSERPLKTRQNSPRFAEDYNLFDNYDLEIEIMKERANSIEKAKNELLETFTHIHETPSFGLQLGCFDDEFVMDD